MIFSRHLGALILFLLASPCFAQSGGRLDPQPYGQRTDAFRRLLFELRFQPVLSFADLQDKQPSESLFIMLGDPRCLSQRTYRDGLNSFVKQGGAVLIATDYETKDEAGKSLSELAGVVVTGESIQCRDQKFIYGNSNWCPFLEPIAPSDQLRGLMRRLGPWVDIFAADGRPDLFRNPHSGDQPLRVATNTPSRLRVTGWLLPKLARLPPNCKTQKLPGIGKAKSEIEPRFVANDWTLFAVGGTVGKGRVLVLADHSIFINRMILPRENDNMVFAANCLHWLRGGASSPLELLRAANSPNGVQQFLGQRNNVLFLEDNHVHRNFEVPLKKVSLPPLRPSEPAIVAAIDKTIARLEDEDFFNRELYANIDDLPGGGLRVYRYALYLLTLAVSMLLAYRFLWRGRYRLETAVPLLTDAVREHEPKASLLDQRRRALLRLGNLWEMGHRLARECFESAGVTVLGAPPRVEIVHGGWRQRWRWRRSVDRLWRLARSEAPIPLSPAALRYRLHELEELKSALANGTIRLVEG